MVARVSSNVVLYGLGVAILALSLGTVLLARWGPPTADAGVLNGVSYGGEAWQELEADSRLCLEHASAKHDMALAVIAGRLTFLQAAARFRTLDARRSPRFRRILAAISPRLTEEEVSCRMVLAYVRVESWDDPDRVGPVVTRLEAELADHVRRGDLGEAMASETPGQADLEAASAGPSPCDSCGENPLARTSWSGGMRWLSPRELPGRSEKGAAAW